MRRYLIALATTSMLTAPAAFAQNGPDLAEVLDAPHFVTWMEAYVRAEPDGGSDRLATLSFGDTIAVTGLLAGEDWYRVELEDGQIGYVWAPVLHPARIAMPGDGAAPGPVVPDEPEGPSEPSADNSFDSANEIDPLTGTPQSFTGYVGGADEVDYYRFTLDDWTDVTITLSDLVSDADIALLDGNGNYIADSINSGSSSEEIFQSLGPGEYFVEVYIYTGDTDYLMQISGDPGEPPPEDTVGNTPADAAPLGTIDGDEGTIEVSEYVGATDAGDYWRLEVLQPANVEITMTGLSSDIDIVLEDDFGSVLTSSAAGGSSDEVMSIPLAPGGYFVHVYPYAGSSDYSLIVEWTSEGVSIPDDSAGNAPGQANDLGTLAGGALTASDWVGPADVSDFYAFEVTEEREVTIRMAPDSSDADVELLGPDEAFIDNSINPSSDDEEIVVTLAPGRYLVRVYIFSGETTYSLSIE
jgi:hypothetical protein